MINFKNFFKDFGKLPKIKPPKKDISERQARHMHPIGRDPISHKKSPGKFVPEYHKPIVEPPTLKRIKRGRSKFEIIHKHDLHQICSIFHIIPNRFEPKKLGNTGILLRFDQSRNKYVLEKNK